MRAPDSAPAALAGVPARAFRLAPPDDPPAFEVAVTLGDHGALGLGTVVGVKIQHDPVVGFFQVMRPRGVREQRGEVPVTALTVQDGQPGYAVRIEAPWCDFAQFALRGQLAVFMVDVEQNIDGRFVGD